MERRLISLGYKPDEIWELSIRQVWQIMRAGRDTMRDKWEHTILLYASIINASGRAKKPVDHAKVLKDMFGFVGSFEAETDEQIRDSWMSLVAMTGGNTPKR
jgi:hypothetical protein